MNTVLQPVLRKRKSFDKVTSPKEVRKASKYCLMTQNQDEAGDLETQFYKVLEGWFVLLLLANCSIKISTRLRYAHLTLFLLY